MGRRRRNETTAPVDAMVSRAVQRAEREDEHAFQASGFQVGDLVVADRDLGVGSLSWISGDVASVVYFASVGEPEAERREVGLDELRPAVLDPNRRCWVESKDTWWPGRVVSSRGREVLVRLPGVTATVPAVKVRVRWNRPYDAPLEEALSGGWTDPPTLADRVNFLRAQAEQWTASRGLTGATAAAITTHEHQLETVRRVLEDPIGRFLFADEVGLGKTIEALMVVRQLLVDSPSAEVQIIVPRGLIGQWRGELRNKVSVAEGADDFPMAQVTVCAADAEQSWSPAERPDLLIVDEAHEVAKWAWSMDERERSRFDLATSLSREVRRTLLLSATPSLHQDQTYLALLHLLDPHRHDLDDLEGFRQKLAMRDAVATALLNLDHRADDPPFLIVDALGELLGALPETEAGLRAEATDLRNRLEAADELVAVDSASVDRLRSQVGERLRLDQRLLRSRRRAVEQRFPVRGRKQDDALVFEHEGWVAGNAWFDRWRTAVLADADEIRPEHARLASLVAECVIADPALLRPIATARLGEASNLVLDDLDVSSADRTLLESVPVGIEERSELGHVPPGVEDVLPALAEHVSEWVWDEFTGRDNVLLMSSFRGVAQHVYAALASRLRPDELALAIRGRPEDANATDAERFASDQDSCHVLVGDSWAEQGLNLQAADRLVMLDLPLDAGRIEQRIGRADRYGERPEVHVVPLVTGDPEALRDRWIQLLTEGYGVFDRSTAAVQITIAELQDEVNRALLVDGARSFERLSPTVVARLEAADRELTKMDVVDARTISEEGAAMARAVAAMDSDADRLEETSDRMLARRLHLNRRRHKPAGVSYWLDAPRHIEWTVNIDGRLQAVYFADVVSHEAHVRRGTFDRQIAAGHGGLCLFRAGDPLLDATERYAYEHMDTGRVSCTWRQLGRVPNEREQVVVGCYFRAAAALPNSPTVPEDAMAEAARRAGLIVPPAIEEVWVSAEGALLEEEDDAAYFAALPFDPSASARDVPLFGPGLRYVTTLVSGPWEESVRAAVEAARQAAAGRLELAGEAEARIAAARREAERRIGLLQDRPDSKPLIERERAVATLIEQAVGSPDVRLVAIQFVVLTDQLAPKVPHRPTLEA